ncbi:MAG: hypothetical protein Q8M83_05680 [bacterium]|nr:hypothetical protein [bacterium]
MALEGISKIIKNRAIKKNKNIHSEAHYWADIISSAFGEKKKFGMYLGLIKRVGIAEAQKIFTEITDSKCKNPGKLFVWKTGKKKLSS